MVGEDLVQFRLVCDIAAVELRSLAADELDAVEYFFGGIVEIVYDDDFVVCFEKREGGE